MPKLLALIVCERVIIDKQEMASFINVFQKMNIQLSGAPLPERAVSPARWNVVSIWQHEEFERNTPFTQAMEVITPNGEVFATSENEFKVTEPDDLHSKLSIEFNTLPIWHEGFVQVRVSLKDSDEPPHVYKFAVKHIPHIQKESDVRSGDS